MTQDCLTDKEIIEVRNIIKSWKGVLRDSSVLRSAGARSWAVPTSDNPGARKIILASNATGGLELEAIGVGISPSTIVSAYLYKEITGAGSIWGGYAKGVNVDAVSGYTTTGLQGHAKSTADTVNSASTLVRGLAGSVELSASAGKTLTITAAMGLVAPSPTITGAGTVSLTGIYGGYIYNQGVAQATNAYGLYIAAQSGAATINRAIHTAGGDHYFGGAVEVVDFLDVDIDKTTSNDVFGISVRATNVGTGDIVGGTFIAETVDNTVSIIIGSDHVAIAQSTSGAAVINTMIGLRAYDYHALSGASDLDVTNSTGILVDSPEEKDLGAGTISVYVQKGLNIANQGNSNTASAYGLYIDAQSGASVMNRAIQTNGGDHYFGGKVYEALTATSAANVEGVHSETINTGTGDVIGVTSIAESRDNTVSLVVGADNIAIGKADAGVGNISLICGTRSGIQYYLLDVNDLDITTGNTIYATAPMFDDSGAGAILVSAQNGLRIANQGNANVTNARGLYIDAQSGATTMNRAIHTAGGDHYFGGNIGSGITPSSLLHLATTNTDYTRAIMLDQHSNDTVGASFRGRKSRNTAIGSHTLVQSGDDIAVFAGWASDGDEFIQAGRIAIAVQEAIPPANNSMPGMITFDTTPDGGTASVERMRIGSDGTVYIGINGGIAIIRSAAGDGTTFNGDGADRDFTIEGDTDANLFFLDASADAIGIGTKTMTGKFNVAGNLNITAGSSYLINGSQHTHDEDDLALTDIVTNDTSTTKHGFCPKLNNNAATYLNGQGAWGAPAGGGDVVGPAGATNNAAARYDLATGKLIQDSLMTIDDAGTVNIPTAQTYNIAGAPHTHDHGTGVTGLLDDDHSQYLLANGSRALSANWDAGSFEVRAETFESDVATGTAPFTIASTTVNTNLNADYLDGNHATAFAAASHSHAGRLTTVTVLTNTGASNFTTQAATTAIILRMVGGGGGGGGVADTTASQLTFGAGGGAGGYAEKYFTVAGSTAYAYQCGAAGAAGASGGGAGGNGSNTTFTVGGTTVTAFGGTGGSFAAGGAGGAIVAGGAGAVVSTNGDVNSGGAPGGHGFRLTSAVGLGGFGGSDQFGGGGAERTTTGAGNAATGYGGGGGGAVSISAGGAQAGGVGTQGVIVVWEFT